MATNGMNASLELAKRLSETVNAAWESGELLEQVTPEWRTVGTGDTHNPRLTEVLVLGGVLFFEES